MWMCSIWFFYILIQDDDSDDDDSDEDSDELDETPLEGFNTPLDDEEGPNAIDEYVIFQEVMQSTFNFHLKI